VFGGKLTTYRKLAEHALVKLQPVLGFSAGAWTASAHLPGGDIPNADFRGFLDRFRGRHPWLPEDVARRLARNYGTRAERMLDGCRGIGDLGRHFGGGLYEVELDYLRRVEWAREADDVIWRRTKLGLRAGPGVAAPIAAWLAAKRASVSREAVS
jgi:glycerol-3-phosphate dehydrogenase